MELANIIGGSSFSNAVLLVGNVVVLLGLVLLAALFMDKLDAEHGPRGFCSGLVGVGVCGVIGGYVGGGLYSQPGVYFGSLAGISVGMGTLYLALKFLEYKAAHK